LHGLIVAELKVFVESQLGSEAWSADDNFATIVAKAAERAAVTQNALLESFGRFLAPRLLSMYPALVKPEWRSLDVIEHTERSIHTSSAPQPATDRILNARCVFGKVNSGYFS